MNMITGPSPDAPQPTGGRIEVASASDLRVVPSPVPPARSTTPDAMGLFKAFQRRWRLALALGLLGGAIAAALAWNLLPPPKYTAEALLLVEDHQPSIIAATKEYQSDPVSDQRTQVALIKSWVISKVVVQPEVAGLEVIKNQGAPAEWLEQQLKAEFKGKILNVTLTSGNAAEVTTLVQAVTRTYLEEVANKEKLQRIQRNQSLEAHYDKLEKQLESKRKLLRGLSSAVGSKDKQSLSSQQRLAVSRQSMAEEELLRTQSDLKRTMAELKVLQNRERNKGVADATEPPAPMAEADVEQTIQNDPGVLNYLRRNAGSKGPLRKPSVWHGTQGIPRSSTRRRNWPGSKRREGRM